MGWSVVFLVMALVAAVLGFWGLEGFPATISKALFIVFLALVILRSIAQAVQGDRRSRGERRSV